VIGIGLGDFSLAIASVWIDEEVRFVQKASIVRDHTNAQYSWVFVKDSAKADVIEIGDIVEQQGTCG